MMPPTPRPPPAVTCSEPGPWQFSHSNLPLRVVLLIRPISVLLKAAAWAAWQPRQTLLPTIIASAPGVAFTILAGVFAALGAAAWATWISSALRAAAWSLPSPAA